MGVAASLLGILPIGSTTTTPVPYVYITSGADSRQGGPFRIYGFLDGGDDANTSTTAGPVTDGITTFAPMQMLFTQPFDPGTPEAPCEGTTVAAVFRGTVQPATAFQCGDVTVDETTGQVQCNDKVGRVFFAGTRLSPPNTTFSPPTPLACGTGYYPCRSQFDSIIYALGAETGSAAFDLNAGTDEDAYRVFRDSRLSAIQMLADPNAAKGTSSFVPDEGRVKGAPKPPPPPGVPGAASSSTPNVVMARIPGQPPPAVRYGTTVCQ